MSPATPFRENELTKARHSGIRLRLCACATRTARNGEHCTARDEHDLLLLTPACAEHSTIIIDVGKSFQTSAIEWFPKYGLRRIDAVLITHAHADGKSGRQFFGEATESNSMRHAFPAMNGLDDLRGEPDEG